MSSLESRKGILDLSMGYYSLVHDLVSACLRGRPYRLALLRLALLLPELWRRRRMAS